MGKGGCLIERLALFPYTPCCLKNALLSIIQKGEVDSSNCFTGSSFGNGYEKPGNSHNSRAACSLKSEVSLLIMNRLIGE